MPSAHYGRGTMQMFSYPAAACARADIVSDTSCLDILEGLQLDVAPVLAAAGQETMGVGQGCTLAEFQRYMGLVGKNAAETLVG
ncbi:hypothetical protein LP421_22435 [Rhizobium sp. RCAM05350]|nr:hypothetical protein LP421_22435 [Rhizobium sp. RCAM05350]